MWSIWLTIITMKKVDIVHTVFRFSRPTFFAWKCLSSSLYGSFSPVLLKSVWLIKNNNVNIPYLIDVLCDLGFHMTPKLSHIFPESCLLILTGILIGLMLFHVKGVHVSPLTPTSFFLYMLPPIILDAGYFVPNRLFFDHLGTILLFAVIGTIWNVVSIGINIYSTCFNVFIIGC